MTRLTDAIVGDAYRSDFSWQVLEDLVDLETRMAGQKEEKEGAKILEGYFEEIGLRDVHLDEFDIDGWWRGSSSIETAGGHDQRYEKDYQVIALPGTPAGTVEGELVDVGYGRPEDFEAVDCEGKILIASSDTPDDYGRWIHRMEKYVSAANAGAVGFIFRNHIAGCLPPTGEVGYDNRPGPIPAVGVSKELGERLVRHAEDDDLSVTVDVDCRNEPSTSVNVVGDIGPDTDEMVLLTAHMDTHDIAEGANDNGAGSVLATEVGRLLAQMEDELETRVRVLVFGSEEIGLKGAYHAMETYDLDDVKCIVNIDGAGRDRTLSINANEFDEILDAFEDVTDERSIPLVSSNTVSPHGDQWAFVQEGVPGAMVSSTNPDKSGRGWGHTHADTLDKIDIRDLREHAVTITNAVCALSETDRDVPSRSREDTRDLIDPGYEQELKLGGRWSY
ncbi:peptidase M28 [Haladaptatus sp. W1]|uniref:M28 family peptidase n=1 Tax=Haladaptatus sp. W1 TaxID=1897478 RepID=UPI000849D798|nr:M28 family peptidase [Haladaptatus sp. W1]ODR79730.1 peptidase M28 [Haladaptatus sp. W1]